MPDSNIKPRENDPSPFERIKRVNAAGNEFWTSREFARVLGYTDYRNFEQVIAKAKIACFNSGQRIEDHFVDITEMIEIGKGGQRAVPTTLMSRNACYLAVQNADPGKEIVALGQTYFAIQTRRQELSDQDLEDERRLLLRGELKKHNTKLADAAKGGGCDQRQRLRHLPESRLPGSLWRDDRPGYSPAQAALKKPADPGSHGQHRAGRQPFPRDTNGRKAAAGEDHREVESQPDSLRGTIKELGGTMPEDLPVAGSIKKLEAKKRKQIKHDKQ